MAEKQSTKSGVKLKKCVCVNTFQDERYGAGNRVHNLKADGEKANCTSCGKEN